ncbi:RNA helicase [Halotalea alkalilenta]|uniref:RNA helicase n=1 Tax=Halotalea alkalilenta TaxID=376489 RepID=A0A172YJV8_9GAMM|nr:RNA helicase [Halotalea alkalilenta]
MVNGNLDASKKRRVALQRPSFAVYDEPTEIGGKVHQAGVWHHDTKDGEPHDRLVCSPLKVEAITSNGDAGFGRLIRFRNSLGNWREWAMPMQLLAGSGESMRAELLGLGVEIDPNAHRLLNSYLQGQRPKRCVIAATSTGWHTPELFIMPRQSIGQGDAIFQSEAGNTDDYRHGGTLGAWREEIGEKCEGNPLLMLAVCAALAGPLLYHLQRPGGGFHIRGDSSSGKTTCLSVSASVWGEPGQFVRTWRATGNGLEGVASQRNDGLLALDEIGEASPKEIGAIIYQLSNGTGKARATRSGAARPTRRWRVVVLSSGELTLRGHMNESGQQSRAGQEIRLLDVSARRTHGAWDELHGLADGRTFSDALQRSASLHYGHVGPLFVEKLIESGEASKLKDMLATLQSQFQADSGQEMRGAERFAIVALAGEIAIEFGILPLGHGVPTAAMQELFNAWQSERGKGQSEDTKVLDSIRDFLDRHGDSAFSALGDDVLVVRDRAGWYRDTTEGRIWMFTSEGLRRAAPGYEITRISEALEVAGWLADRGPKGRAKKVKVSGSSKWLYHLREVES